MMSSDRASEKINWKKINKKIILIENSREITGAFNSALAVTEALAMQTQFEWVISSSASTNIRDSLNKRGLIYHELPLVEIGRSCRKLVTYLPLLVTNSIRLLFLLRSRKADILIVNDYYNLLGAVAKAFGWRGLLITYVRLIPTHQNPLLNKVWVWASFKYSDSIIAVSKTVAKQLPPCKKLRVIYDPYIVRHTKSSSVSESKKKRTYVIFLYIANYITGKGHFKALQAFSRAYATNKNIKLRFFGSDMNLTKNKELRSKLELEVSNLGLNSVVDVMDQTTNVTREILASDVILNFSDSESFSLTCVEGSAHARPVIATRCGGPEEVIDHEISGLLVDVSDVPAMTDAILLLTKQTHLRDQMGRSGAQIIKQRFSADKFTKAFQELVNES